MGPRPSPEGHGGWLEHVEGPSRGYRLLGGRYWPILGHPVWGGGGGGGEGGRGGGATGRKRGRGERSKKEREGVREVVEGEGGRKKELG